MSLLAFLGTHMHLHLNRRALFCKNIYVDFYKVRLYKYGEAIYEKIL